MKNNTKGNLQSPYHSLPMIKSLFFFRAVPFLFSSYHVNQWKTKNCRLQMPSLKRQRIISISSQIHSILLISLRAESIAPTKLFGKYISKQIAKININPTMNGGYGFGGYGNGMMPTGYGSGAFSYGMSSPFVHFNTDEYILFDFWHPFSSLGMAFSCLCVFVVSAGFEAIRWFRQVFGKRTELVMPSDQTQNNGTLPSGSNSLLALSNMKLRFRPTACDVLLYAVQLLISYILMIIVMTLNGWLIFAEQLKGHRSRSSWKRQSRAAISAPSDLQQKAKHKNAAWNGRGLSNRETGTETGSTPAGEGTERLRRPRVNLSQTHKKSTFSVLQITSFPIADRAIQSSQMHSKTDQISRSPLQIIHFRAAIHAFAA
ncbi:hypothetical protein niasHT_002339 [Heterodera trifolii]|uniref:Copper transport protein n=1 Tax=Heterodera trifolii TaxID=157864 RepID=A0ABD2LNH4_9BILA